MLIFYHLRETIFVNICRPIWRRACWSQTSWPLPDTENQNIRIPIPDTQYPPPNNLHPIPYTQYPYSRFSGHKLEARAMAMASSHGLKRLPWLGAWGLCLGLDAMTVFPMAMALGLRPLPVRRAWPRPAPWPGPWPRHKQISKGQGTSKSPKAKAKANGHKLVAMAQDIRYPGVRVG